MMSVREKDTSFVDTFLTAAVGILRTKDCKDTATDKTSFSIVPKKVKIVSIFNTSKYLHLFMLTERKMPHFTAHMPQILPLQFKSL